jgi:aminoglycoside phosphotransferase (APT) family kinase protein
VGVWIGSGNQVVMSDERESIVLIRRLLRVPGSQSVVLAADGSDHWAFDVNGVFIARKRKRSDEDVAAAIEREAALLAFVSRVSPISVPEVVALEPEAGLIVFRRLPGISLFDRPPLDPLAFADVLAELVAALQSAPAALVTHLVERDEYPLNACVAEAIGQMTRVATYLTSAQRWRVEQFLASPAPPESAIRTLCHNDLGAEHVLASDDGSKLTGIIDWSDAAITDPARDLGRLLRDFGFGIVEAVLRRIGGDEGTFMRAAFYARCALLEDLAYGIEASRPEYVAHALARFPETFS